MSGIPAVCIRSVCVLNGESIDEVDERGERITGDTLLMLLSNQTVAESFISAASQAFGKMGAGVRYQRRRNRRHRILYRRVPSVERPQRGRTDFAERLA